MSPLYIHGRVECGQIKTRGIGKRVRSGAETAYPSIACWPKANGSPTRSITFSSRVERRLSAAGIESYTA